MKKLVFFLMLLVLVSLAYAKDLQTNNILTNPGGLNIVHPQLLYFHMNSNINLSFDVLDSNFTKLDSSEADCSFFMVDNYGSNFTSGELLYENYWYFNFDSQEDDEYSFYVYCNATNGEAGYVSDTIIISSIGGEETIIPLFSFIILIGLLIGFYVFMIKNFNVDLFEENGAIKIFLALLSFWLTLLPIYVFVIFNDRFGVSYVSDFVNALWPYLVWINIGLTFYFMMYALIKMLGSIWDKR